MFVLTCPSCNHAARVKFARFNAVATCPACNARFRVDGESTSVDRDGSVAGPAHDLTQHAPPPTPLEVQGGANPAAFAATQDPDEPTAEEMWDELFGEAPAPVHEAPLDWKPRESWLFLPASIPTSVAMMLMVGSAIAAAVVAGAISSGDRGDVPREIVQQPVDWDELARRERQMGNGSESEGNGGSGGEEGSGEPEDSSTVEPSGEDPETEEEPEPSDPEQEQEGESGEDSSTRTAEEESSLPTMRLQRSIAYEPRWETLREPKRAMHPTMASDVLLWMPRLQHDEESGRTMFTAMYLADNDQIYQSGFLHVQLLDEEGQAIAELKQVVPALNARQGLQVRLMVPTELDERSERVVAQFTPVDRVRGAEPVEAMESQTRVRYSGGGPVLELTITNPNGTAVHDPRVVVELLTEDGWPVGMYRGVVEGTIEPGESLVFEVRPPVEEVEEAEAEPGRVEIRGYALKDE